MLYYTQNIKVFLLGLLKLIEMEVEERKKPLKKSEILGWQELYLWSIAEDWLKYSTY